MISNRVRRLYPDLSILVKAATGLGLLGFLLTAPLHAQETQFELYFPQFAAGGGYFSQITMINPNPGQSGSVSLRLSDQDGVPLSDLEFLVDGGPSTIETNVDGEVAWTIQPSGTTVLETMWTGDLILGSAVSRCALEIDGVIVFGGDFGLAGVQSSDEFSRGFIGSVEINGSAIRTAIAIQNLEGSGVSLTLELLNQGGVRQALSPPIVIPLRGRVARFVDELFSGSGVDFSNFRGSVRLVSDEDVAAMMLQTRPGQLATLPVTELPREEP